MKADISRISFDRAKHYAAVVQQQGRVQLDADWNEQAAIARHHVEASLRDLIGPHGAPADTAGFGLTIAPTDGGSGTLNEISLTAGRYYVDGILCENEADVTFAAQPSLAGASLPTGDALLYLEVWRRVVTPLDDPAMRETALGEADTAVRLQTVWQVKAVPADGVTILPNGFPNNWETLTAAPTGRMKAALRDVSEEEARETLIAPGTFEGLDNQLYRVEVHAGGDLSTAVFKWSRDNGVVTTAVTTYDKHTFTVQSLGRDAALGFAAGQWVEIGSVADELAGRSWPLTRVIDVVEDALQIVLDSSVDLTGLGPAQTLRLRRWDGVLPGSEAARKDQPLTDASELEAGVSVTFEDGTFRPGDYWLVPARADGAAIYWPGDTSQPPQGVERHYAPLVIVASAASQPQVTKDLRRLFTALTADVAPTAAPKAIHLNSFSLGEPGTNAPLTYQTFITKGLYFDFSDAIAGRCANDGSFEVTLEQVTADLSSTVSRMHGSVTISRNRAVWMPRTPTLPIRPPTFSAASEAQAGSIIKPPDPVYIVRVTLRGSMLWSANDDNPRLYLDGTTLRQDDGYKFPSGIGVAASDFNAFFVLNSNLS